MLTLVAAILLGAALGFIFGVLVEAHLADGLQRARADRVHRGQLAWRRRSERARDLRELEGLYRLGADVRASQDAELAEWIGKGGRIGESERPPRGAA